MQTHQGLTLDRYLKEKGPLGPDQAAKIAIQVAQQMGPAAGSLLIHPGRILVTKEGTVRLLPPPAEELALPAIVEFPAYASPEEIRGGQSDIRSGLYSLGSTLFELLSGRPPFQRKDPKDLLRAHLEDPVPDLHELSTAVTPGLAETVRELLEKDPDLRIQSTEELVRRLKQALHGSGAPAASSRPPSKATVPKPVRKSGSSYQLKYSGSHPLKPHQKMPPRRGSHAPGLQARSRAEGRSDGGDEMDGVESLGEADRKRSVPYFSIAGAVLGLFIGLLFISSLLKGAKEEAERKKDEERQAEAGALLKRKKSFLDFLEDQRKGAEQSFAKTLKVPEEKKRDQLILCLSTHLESPSIKQMADELVKTRAFSEDARKPGEEAKLDQEFQKQKEEALKLYSEGKIGDAIHALRDISRDCELRHDAEITELVVKKWSPEIEERWKATEAAANKLEKDSEGEKAIEEYRKAKVYADEPYQRKCEERITRIQQLLTLQAGRDKVKLPKDQLEEDSAASADSKDADASGSGQEKKKTEKKSEKKTDKPKGGSTKKEGAGDAGADSDSGSDDSEK